jgi:RHS repeat-associated protein
MKKKIIILVIISLSWLGLFSSLVFDVEYVGMNKLSVQTDYTFDQNTFSISWLINPSVLVNGNYWFWDDYGIIQGDQFVELAAGNEIIVDITEGSIEMYANHLIKFDGFAPYNFYAIVMNNTTASNNIETKVLLTEIQDESAIANLDPEDVQHKILYADPNGKTEQVIAVHNSPAGYDYISPREYDTLGREPKQYLPYVSSTQSDGSYIDDPITEQLDFYNTPPAGVTGDSYPYSESKIENTPLNRVIELGSPGSDWQPEETSYNGHTMKNFVSTNTSSEVRRWNENGTFDTYFAADEITITETVDENGNSSFEYEDKAGNTILKKINDGSRDLYTYYVYDEKGNLIYIIPPKCFAAMQSNGYDINTNNYLDKYITWFEYDSQNRLLRKHLPEMSDNDPETNDDALWYAYNIRGQIVVSCDPELDNHNQRLFTKYDVFGREIISGKYNSTTGLSSQEEIQAELSSATGSEIYETRDLEGQYGYTNNAFPSLDYCQPLSVTYYDDYDFNYDGIPDPAYEYIPDSEFDEDEVFNRVKGKITGQRTWILQGSDVYIRFGNETYDYCPGNYTELYYKGDDIVLAPGFETTPGQNVAIGSEIELPGNSVELESTFTVNFYDKYGRVIQTQHENHLGGLDVSYTKYDFPGNVVATKTIHSSDESNPVTVRKWLDYDNAKRLKCVFQQINDEDYVLLYSNVYNELGQLLTKRMDGGRYPSFDPTNLPDPNTATYLQELDYTYNIRGWLRKINDPSNLNTDELFALDLGYCDRSISPISQWFIDTLGYEDQYNGNILSMSWILAGDRHRFYGYQYDDINQLKKGTYMNSPTDVGDYSLSDITYDRNGNIMSVNRNGFTDPGYEEIDDLEYTYYGNKLIAVDDNSGVGEGNDFDDSGSIYSTTLVDEYIYDANGNLTHDANKGIDISYNHLNLPTIVDFGDGNRIEWIYDAGGNKLRKSVYESDVLTSSREYVGGFEYYRIQATFFVLFLDFVATEVGKAKPDAGNFDYIYNLKDHLGNVRLSFHDDGTGTAEVLQQDHYYPFGMRLAGLSENAGDDNKYLYNGKELVEDHNLNWYHYGARYYDPQLGRWHVVDPADEFHSPYCYVGNMPTIATDPDGSFVQFAIPLAVIFMIEYLLSPADLAAPTVLNLEDIEVPENTESVVVKVAGGTAETTGNVGTMLDVTVLMGVSSTDIGPLNMSINMTSNGVHALAAYSNGDIKEGNYSLAQFLSSPIGHLVSTKLGGRAGAFTSLTLGTTIKYVGSGQAQSDYKELKQTYQNGWEKMWSEFYRMYRP